MSVNNKPAEGTPVFKKRRTEPADIETGITSTTNTALWKIKDFAKFRHVNSLIEGQKFEMDVTDYHGVTSQFRVSLIRTMEGDKTYWETEDSIPPAVDNIGLRVGLLSKDVVAFKFSAEVQRATRRKLNIVKNERITSASQNEYIEYYGLFKNGHPESYLPLEDGDLIIRLSFEIFSAIPDSGLAASANFKNQRLSKLQKIMSTLEKDTESADVTIISNDGEKFPVHKFILMNISSVFEEMLNADMVEKKTGEIKLSQSGKCVKILRHFIYTGKLAEGRIEAAVVLELANAAKMYFLNDLVVFIDKVLGVICTAENAPELMVLAKKLDMKRAQKQILSVVKVTTKNVDDFMAVVETLSSK